MIELGSEVKDKVSGLVGTAMSMTEFLNGCIQYAVQPKMKKGATEIPSWNIDAEQLIVIKPKTPKKKRKPPGGPMHKILLERRS